MVLCVCNMKIGKFTFRAETFKEGKLFVSLSPELGVSSFGETAKEAKDSLKEAVELFLEECERLGTLKEVLNEAGFKTQGKAWIPPRPKIETIAIGA